MKSGIKAASMAAGAAVAGARREAHGLQRLLKPQIRERAVQLRSNFVEHLLASDQVVCEDPSVTLTLRPLMLVAKLTRMHIFSSTRICV